MEALAAMTSLRRLDVAANVEIGLSGVRSLVRLPNLEALSVTPSGAERRDVVALLAERFGGVATPDRWTLRGGPLI